MTITAKPTPQELIDADEPYLTSSMIEAILTCPRWGLINSVNLRSFTDNARSMALEAGSAMHEVFSVLNLLQVGLVQGLPDHMHHHGKRLFPEGRWNGIVEKLDLAKHDQHSVEIIEDILLRCIASSDFYDDPGDKYRTTSNLERCTFEMINYWSSTLSVLPIYVADRSEPSAPIGVEQSLDFLIDGYSDYNTQRRFRFIGLADAVYQNPDTKKVTLGEYKTSSRITDSYLESFQTRHQITAYQLGLSAYHGVDNLSGNTILIASEMPPKNTKQNVLHTQIPRDVNNFVDLFDACCFAWDIIDAHGDEPTNAPMFTHSCNRYFRTCSMMPLCTSGPEDRKEMYDSMFTREMSPSEQMAMMKRG